MAMAPKAMATGTPIIISRMRRPKPIARVIIVSPYSVSAGSDLYARIA